EQRFQKCLAGYDADPRLYTTAISMQDLDEVREALGYDQIDLWGGSYGTRAALVYLRDHGQHARAAVLDGVAPPSQTLPVTFARDAQRSMDLLFDSCARDAACAKAFPRLGERFGELLEQLARAPARVIVQDPLTAASEKVTIARDTFAAGL